jgi:hypothetical protein
MTNGFYNSNKLTKSKKKAFIKDAIVLAYNVSCQSKYTDDAESNHRSVDKRLVLNEVINYLLADKTSKLDCIDRYQYNNGVISEEFCEYEICFHTTSGFNNGWTLLYIFVNKESFKTLVDKYNLKLIEW